MAKLLADSDEAELREVVRRWKREAPNDEARRVCDEFGARLLELKAALGEAPVPPSREELELALTMMLNLAATKRA